MKKIFFMFVLFLIPFAVKANIMCNDGTTSPSCQDCHQGCCSHHGGCANSNYNNTVNTNNTYNNTENNDSYDETSDEKNDLYDETDDENYETTTENDDADNETDNATKSSETTNATDFLIGTGILGGIGYGIYKAKTKNK